MPLMPRYKVEEMFLAVLACAPLGTYALAPGGKLGGITMSDRCSRVVEKDEDVERVSTQTNGI